LVQWAKSQFSAAELQLVLAGTSVCFDLSVFELWAPLSSGGAVVLVENALALPQVAEEVAVTLVNTVPSVMAELLRDGYRLPESVVTVNLAGEALSNALVATVYEAGQVQQVNDLYGPTEATTYSTWERREGSGRATIGRPISNTEVYILDRWQQPVAVGVRGEIYLSGAGVGRGYWQRAELTAERFVPHPYSERGGERLYRTGDEGRYLADGRIEYLGRRDQQVKLRGYRIELGEIESALESYAGVRQAAVTVREQQLVGYVVGLEGSEREAAAELRPYLRERLPDYMVPQRWVVLEQMPLTSSGTIDRKRLPEPSGAGAGALEQEAGGEWSPVEELVAGIWSEVLRRGTVGKDENFFELGGHSLLATQVLSR
ncbi:MAG: non-ribosomal peptide synthetase, partial [Pseudomonas sp.]